MNYVASQASSQEASLRLNLYNRYISISTEVIGYLGRETTPRPSKPAQLSSMVGKRLLQAVSCAPITAARLGSRNRFV